MILGIMLMLVLQLGPGPTFCYANGDPTLSRLDWVQQLLRYPVMVWPAARRSLRSRGGELSSGELSGEGLSGGELSGLSCRRREL
jgi:hypothetical protein